MSGAQLGPQVLLLSDDARGGVLLGQLPGLRLEAGLVVDPDSAHAPSVLARAHVVKPGKKIMRRSRSNLAH